MSGLGAIYGRIAQLRRSWYEARPHARLHLSRPVISVGNLVVGGSGKTPIVAALARMLRDAGERPAVLSRGYGRRRHADGVVVVSDGRQVLATVDESADEPQMLARALEGVPVLVSPDRYLAGTVADRRFGATVMLLDDGFQHLRLARTMDLLVVAPRDLEERMLPTGRLREPLGAARAADAVLVYGTLEEARGVANALGVNAAFAVERRYGTLRPIGSTNGSGDRVLAVAGIAQPERFFAAVREQGFEPVGTLQFRDHYWFTARDVAQVVHRAKAAGADLIVTTEKDAVRLEAHLANGRMEVPWAALPMEAVVQPADAFGSWLLTQLRGGGPP